MIVITGGRRSGKTTACVRWLLENPGRRILMVSHRDRRTNVLHMLHGHVPGFDWQSHVYMVEEYTRYMRGRSFNGMEVGIDDLETVLAVLFGGRVEFATANATWIPLTANDEPIRTTAHVGEAQAEIKPRMVLNDDDPRMIR